MAGVYSTRFFLIHDLNGVVDYLVPPGKTAVVRDLEATNLDDTKPNVGIGWYGAYPPGGAPQGLWLVFLQMPATNPATLSWHGRLVYPAGETIRVFSGAHVDTSISGYLLNSA